MHEAQRGRLAGQDQPQAATGARLQLPRCRPRSMRVEGPLPATLTRLRPLVPSIPSGSEDRKFKRTFLLPKALRQGSRSPTEPALGSIRRTLKADPSAEGAVLLPDPHIGSARQATFDAAFLASSKRFKGRRPQPPELPTDAWINPPPSETDSPQRSIQPRAANS